MYTQCPECGTVFRLSADVLRVAQGDVRCGICSTVFSAIGSLSDAPTSHLAHSAPAEDTMTVEEVSGSEIIELGAQGQALPPEQPRSDDEAWPRDSALDGGPPAAADDLVPDSAGAREAPVDSQEIEVSIADAEVAAMLEASGTWERLRMNYRSPDGRASAGAAAGEPVEAVSPAAESMAESMAASANAATGTFSGRMRLLELVAASEQITLESPQIGTAAAQRPDDGPAAADAALEPGPDEIALDELDAALEDYLDAEQPAEVPPDLTARLQPEPMPELATHGAISLPEAQEFELPLDAATEELWDDDLDEAAAEMREREIEALAAQLAEAPVTSPATGAAARKPAAAIIAPRPPKPLLPAAPEPAAASRAEPAPDPGDIQRAVAELVAAVGTPAAPAESLPGRIDLDATDEFPILVLDESDEDDAAIEARVAASRLLAALDGAPPVASGAAAAGTPQPAGAAEALEPAHAAAALESPRAVATPEPVVAGSDEATAAAAAPTDTDRFAGDISAAVTHESADDAELPHDAREAGDAPATGAPLQILIPPELRAAYAPSAQRQAEEELGDLSFAVERPRVWPWALAALLLLLALGVQVLHVNRDRVAADPTYGPWLARAYALVGLELETPVDLGAFELRHWGAASDALARDRLRFRASIVNHAAHPQPFPLLRLSLQDRFGNLVGTRDALPQEYLRGTSPAAPGMLPGQRVDAELVVVDPGEDAVGFELELCVPAGAGLRCAKDPGGS